MPGPHRRSSGRPGDALALVGHCTSCGDCSTKLAGAYDTVHLDNDLLNVSGSCIGAAPGESNKIPDCQGHATDGDGIGNECQCGDASGDGILDGTDVLMNRNSFLGRMSGCNPDIADTDHNGVVDGTDVLEVQNAFLGLTSSCSLTCARSGSPDTRPTCP